MSTGNYIAISKEETFSRAVRKLEQLKLISVARGTGTTNVYTLTLNHHRQTVVPPTNGSTPDNGGYTTPDNGDKTTPDNGGTVKDIFKENFKEKIFVQNAQVQAKQDQVLVEQKLESDRLEKQKAEQEAKANLEAKAKAKAESESQLLKNFELFWSVYPNKKSKKTAFEKFKRIDFKKTSFESIMISLEKQKQSDDWTKNGGQYVPMPQTWIFNERWTDEIQAPVQQQNHTDVNAYWTELEGFYTAAGRLHYAGIGVNQMPVNVYRQTWKSYENLMVIAIESAIDEASKAIDVYKKKTYQEVEN